MSSARATLTGSIQIGMINVPIKLYTAARQEGSIFNNVHQHADGSVSKVGMKNTCSGCGTDIPYPSLQKGVEQADGTFIVIEPFEITAIQPKTNGVMQIDKFVPLAEVDPLYFDSSFYADLDTSKDTIKKMGDCRKAFKLLFWFLSGEGMVGLSKFASRGKEHNIVIRAVGKRIMVHTLFTADEVRDVECYDPTCEDGVSFSPAEVKMGKALIEAMTGTFDPSELKDEASEKLAALIASKTGRPSATSSASGSKPPSDGGDLEAMLNASLNKKTKAAGSSVQ